MLGSQKRGFTLVELVVVILIIGFLFVLLLPALVQNRDTDSRRSACTNHMKQLGLALHNFADARKCFPGSSTLPLFPPETTPEVGSSIDFGFGTENRPGPDDTRPNYGNGYSWMVMILPYVEMGTLYQRLDVVGDPDGTNFDATSKTRPLGPWQLYSEDARIIKDRTIKEICNPLVWSMPVDTYLCPSRSSDTSRIDNSMGLYDNKICMVGGVDTTPAATSYVAISATHNASFMGTEKSRWAGGRNHPNGVMYPGSKTGFRDMKDGTSNTVIVCETKEPTYAAWYDGTTAGIYGLIKEKDGKVTGVLGTTDPDTTPRDFEQAVVNDVAQAYGNPKPDVKTALNYGDQHNQYYMKGIAPFADQTRSNGKEWRYGPSSEHPGIVLHLYGDGSVHPLSAGISPEVYMHLITRNGGESIELD